MLYNNEVNYDNRYTKRYYLNIMNEFINCDYNNEYEIIVCI